MLDAGNTHREMRPARFGLATSASAGHADNRFIWLLVRRWKKLPDGGNLDPTDLAPVIKNLKSAVGRARTRGAMQRDNAARDLWHRAYDELSEGDPGLAGAMLARSEAQVTLLALVYALADGAACISVAHLTAPSSGGVFSPDVPAHARSGFLSPICGQ